MSGRLARGLECAGNMRSWKVLATVAMLAGCASGDDGMGATPDAGDPGPTPDASGPRPDAGPGTQGCAPCEIEFAYEAAGATSVELRGSFAPDGWTVGVPMTLEGGRFVARLALPHARVVQYKFVVVDGTGGTTWVADPANPDTVSDNFGGQNSVRVADCGCGPTSIDWRDAMIYFVLVDRFVDGDGSNNAPIAGVEPPANFAGGDLAGVLSTLEDGYFTDLGVNVLWLSAPMDNADGLGVGDDGRNYSSYHGYWPSRVDEVEARVGDLQTLQAVVDAAHARGIRIVLDYVMNHVHAESPVYAAHPDWFWPLDDGSGSCVCGEGCSWDPPEGLRCWFRSYLPDFDFRNADARGFSVNNAIDWIKRTGVDGYRLDAVKHIETSWIHDLRARVNAEIEFGGRVFYMVGETFTGDRGLIGSYVNPDTLLDGQFDFPMRAEVVRTVLMRQGGMDGLGAFLDGNDAFYAGGAVMGTFLGNHDLPRSVHLAEDTPQFGEWDAGKSRGWTNQPSLPGERDPFERLLVAYTLLYTTRGAPLLYYGDEIGMAGAGDPDNRRPMQWTGLTADQEWLRERIRRLTRIRSEHPATRRGGRTTRGATGDAMVYEMSDGTDRVFVALNRSDGDAAAPGLPDGAYRDLLGDQSVTAPLTLPARSAMVLVPE